MKQFQNQIKNIINGLVIIISFILFILIPWHFQVWFASKKVPVSKPEVVVSPAIDINQIIAKYNKEKKIISKNFIFDEFVSLIVYDEIKKHSTLLLDLKKGTEVNFDYIIKKDRLNDFWNQVYNLLALKYPKFIVDTIKTGAGNIYYDIKENEMIIHFENFSFGDYALEDLNLRVNYNEVKNYLNFKIKLDSEYNNESAYDYDKTKKAVAFTFDDGPNNKYSLAVMQELLDNKARATFFMVGQNMNRNRSIVATIHNNGFEIGSHTYNHINMKRVKMEKIRTELQETNRVYHDITGSDLNLLRPPYGCYNAKILKQFDYAFIIWSIDTNDWRYHDPDYIVNHILTNITDGSIILMHDSYSTTLEAVKRLLPILYLNGYQVVTVSDLAALKGRTIEKNQVYFSFQS